MAGNVWMRIWPNQRKIIRATKDGTAVEPGWVATAKLRSKHNTYMSVPLLFTMVSNHFPGLYGAAFPAGVAFLAVIILVGWCVAYAGFRKAGSAAPAQF